jgi:hypothetical protein
VFLFNSLGIGKPDDHQTISDVLFGDVYICGGQSNMEEPVAVINNASAELVRITPLLFALCIEYLA